MALETVNYAEERAKQILEIVRQEDEQRDKGPGSLSLGLNGRAGLVRVSSENTNVENQENNHQQEYRRQMEGASPSSLIKVKDEKKDGGGKSLSWTSNK